MIDFKKMGIKTIDSAQQNPIEQPKTLAGSQVPTNTPPQVNTQPTQQPTGTSNFQASKDAGFTSPKKSWLESHPWMEKVLTEGDRASQKYVLNPLSKATSFIGKSTTQLLAKPLVSVKAGITGDYSPQEIPVAGKVTPFETPEAAASTYLAQGAGQKITPQDVEKVKSTASENLKEAAKTDVGAYLEMGAPGLSEVTGKVLGKAKGLVPKVIMEPAEEAVMNVAGKIKSKVASGFNWISQKSYAQALKSLLGKETAQNISAKVAERAPIGTTKSLIKAAEREMSGFDRVLSEEMQGETGKKIINIDDIVNRSDSYRSGDEIISSTGLNKQKSMDAARQRLLGKADESGNIALKDLQPIKQRWGNDIKRLFNKQPGTLTADEEADMELYFAMRDAIAEQSPKLAEENAKYHYAKLVSDSLKRKEAIEMRQNWTGLIGNMHAVGQVAKGNFLGAAVSLIGDKLLGGTLGRTLIGAGAKGIEREILSSFTGVTPAAARWLAPIIYNHYQKSGEITPEEQKANQSDEETSRLLDQEMSSMGISDGGQTNDINVDEELKKLGS